MSEERGWLKEVLVQNKKELADVPSWLRRERPPHHIGYGADKESASATKLQGPSGVEKKG